MGWLLFHFFIVDFCPTRRFRNMRRYSLVNQHEDTDALLDDDEDEPPLDLRSDSRDEGRSRDDAMLDLGTGMSLCENYISENYAIGRELCPCRIWNVYCETNVWQIQSVKCVSDWVGLVHQRGRRQLYKDGGLSTVLWVTNLHLLRLALHEGESCGA